jgi:hypothetical protein
MASILSWAKKTAKNVLQDEAHVAKSVVQHTPIAAVGRLAQQAPQAYQQATHAIAQQTPALNNPVTRFVNNQFVKPAVQAESHVGSVMQGNNPYTGNVRQQLGQAGNDALNLGSLVPIGKGAKIAVTGGKVLPRVIEGAKLGAKSGGVIGAGYGLSDANTRNLNLKDTAKDVATTAGISAVAGGALGGAAPAVGPLAKVAGRRGVDIATMKPHRNISDNELAAAVRVQKRLSGYGDEVANVKPGDEAIYRKVQKKLGADVNDHQAVSDAIGRRMTYETQLKQKVDTVKAANTRLNNYVQVGGSLKPTNTAVGAPTKSTRLSPPKVQVGAIEQPRLSTSLAQDTPKVATNRLTKGALEGRQNISKETAAQLTGEHNVRNTANLAEESGKAADALPVEAATEQAHSMLSVPLGHVDDAQTGFIAKTIERLDTEATRARSAGDAITADRLTRESAALHDGLSEHATARGQANQALIMLYNQSPQGMLYRSLTDLTHAGVKDTPELRGKLQPLVDAIKTATNQEAKIEAIARFHQAVSKEMPQHVGDKLISIWKAGLLSGVKTQQGNAISNATFGVLKKLSDPISATVDRIISMKTGQRTVGVTNKGLVAGGKDGLKSGWYTLKTGIDKRNITGDKYEQHAEIDFNTPAIDKTIGTAVRFVFRGMNAADQPFWYGAFKNSMYDQAKAAGVTRGLHGSQLKQFMDETVANPSPQMADMALREANKSTLNYDTIGSKAIQGLHKGIDILPGVTEAGKSIAHGVVNVLAPFVRVPTAFLSRTVDFTPLGIGKEVFHQIASKQFDQRALSKAIGEGATGTGIIAMGIALSHQNLLSGDYPKNDQKEAQRWKAEGITPNSVKLGGKWISLNYLGPVGLLFNAGHKMQTSSDPGAASQVASAIGGLGQGLLGQSFLQGFSGFSDAITDPERSAKSFVNSQIASLVPNILNDVSNATDSYQRQADTVVQSVKNKIPGLRETNKRKIDVYGNDLKQAAGRLNTLNGVKPSNDISNKNAAVAEVSRLHKVDPNNGDLQVTPIPVKKTISVEGKNVALSDNQRYDLQKQIGQSTQSNWSKLIQTDEYKVMTDPEKAAALGNIRQLATEDATRSYVVANNLSTYNKSESKKAIALNQNSDSIASLAASKATGGSSSGSDLYYKTPDAEYKALKKTYESNLKQGYTSVAKQIKDESALKKAEVGSKFDKNIRDLYNLSNAQVYQYVSTNADGKKLADQILAYGDALKDAGVTTKNKFKTKYGAVTLGKATVSTSKKGRKSTRSKNTGAVKLAKINTKSKGFSTKRPGAPKFKVARLKVPKNTVKTPKVTTKVA